MASPSVPLPQKLEEVLAAVPDRAYAGRLERVYRAAAATLFRLSDLDLVRYEATSVEESPDLALWEQMAPVIRDTVVEVNELLMTLREQFPVHPPGDLKASESEEVLAAASRSLAQQVTQLGESMRNPQVVSDRWNLLATVQACRSRFRQEIGELVHQTALVFAEVHPREVLPLYEQELRSAIDLRGRVAELIRMISHRAEEIAQAEPEDVQWHARQLEKELDAFGRQTAYRALRAQDKRRVLELRQCVAGLAEKAGLTQRELLQQVEPFLSFVRSLSQVNRRELLVAHDREVSAALGVLLERAAGEAQALDEALIKAQELWGRDPELDAFLRKVRTAGPAADSEGVKERAERLLALLGNLELS